MSKNLDAGQLDDQKGRWITNVALAKLVAPHVTSGGELAKIDIANRAQILNEYLAAIQKTWPVEWDDRTNYNLSQPLGFEMLLRALPRVMFRVQLADGKAFTAKNFAKQLDPLRGATLDIAGLGKITLDWVKGTMGFFASAAARKALGDAILDVLAP